MCSSDLLPEAIRVVNGSEMRGEANRLAAIKAVDTVLGNDLEYMKIKDPAAKAKYRQDRINEYMGMLGGQGGEQPAPQGGQPAPAGAPITSKAEYDKLPSGAHYVAPNGKTYVKG